MDAAAKTNQPGAERSSFAARGPARGRRDTSPLLALQGDAGNGAVVEILRRMSPVATAEPMADEGLGYGYEQTEVSAKQPRSTVHEVLRTSGNPLDGATLADAETRLDANFSAVRVHQGQAARSSAAEIGARAYTSGHHIVLGEGGTDKRTLYHELTHVIQQQHGPVAGTDNGAGLRLSHPSDRFEREAEANAARALATDPAPAPAPAPAQDAGTTELSFPAQGVTREASVQRMEQPGQGGEDPPGQTPGPGRTPEDVTAVITELVDNPPMVNYGARRQGRAHGEFWMRFPRSKSQEATEETLSGVSALMFDSARGAQEQARAEDPDGAPEEAGNREIQGMLINDRVVFASNYNSSLDTLVERGRRDTGAEPTLQELLAIRQSDEGATRGLRGHEVTNHRDKMASLRRKNAAVVSGQRGEGEQGRAPDATAKALRAQLHAPVIVVNIEDDNLHDMLTGRAYEGRVFLLRFAALDPRAKKQGKNKGKMTAEGSVHAEQKLLLALQHAGISPHTDVKGPLTIMGKYRPCMGCAAALMYYRERLGFEGLSFDENYGHYFQGSVDSLYEHHRHMMDDDYLEYIRSMVHNDITSTPAMMHEAPPEGADFRRGGHTLRVPGRYASRQADVTPPTSDAEFDEDGLYHRTERPLQDAWTLETANAGIGQGSQTHKVPRRKFETLSTEQAQELEALWNGSKGSPPTNAGRQRAVELAYRYKNQERMTLKYLGGIINLTEGRLGGHLTRYEDEGHWDHTPSRSGKVERQPRDRKKGDPTKRFTKGGALDSAGKEELRDVIQGLPGNAWCRDWARIDGSGDTRELAPNEAPDDVLRTAARLKRDQGCDVPSLSRFLHTGDKGDNLRKAIARKGNKLLETYEKSTKKVKKEEEDVEMGGMADYPQNGESSRAGAQRTAPVQVPGYTLHTDAMGQTFYTDDDDPDGAPYVRVAGRMVRMDFSQDAEMSGTGGY